MSFYDDASLIMYPSGYKEDKIYSLKPTNGTGDLNFSRASSATRVNAEGLIEEASVLGAEEVTNGDFANGLTGFGTQIPSGQTVEVTSNQLHVDYDSTATQGSTGVNQTILTAGKQYKITIDVASITGTFRVQVGGQVQDINTLGIHTFYKTPTSTILYIIRQSNAASCEFRLNSVSVKEVITSNVPRIDYSNGCGSLLLEKQSTNLITYSESFDNAAWSNNGTIVSNAAISPDGTQNADLFYAATDTGRRVFYNTTIASGSSYTVSVYAKANNKNFLYFTDIDNQLNSVWFDLSNGTYSAPAEGSASIENAGSGWYRCSLTTTSSTTTGWAYFGISDTSGSASFTANGTDGVYVYGAQLEQSTYPTSYIISNSGTSTTRIADAASKTGISSLINSPEGVLYAEIATTYDSGLSRRITLSDGTISNRISFEFDESVENTLKVFVDGVVLTYAASDLSALNKIAFKYKSGDHQLYFNGVEVATSTSAAIPTGLNQLSFDGGNGSNDFYGNCQNLMVFPSVLTDDELSDLTGAVHQTFNSLATFYGYTIL